MEGSRTFCFSSSVILTVFCFLLLRSFSMAACQRRRARPKSMQHAQMHSSRRGAARALFPDMFLNCCTCLALALSTLAAALPAVLLLGALR